jgi:hypothetical protein
LLAHLPQTLTSPCISTVPPRVPLHEQRFQIFDEADLSHWPSDRRNLMANQTKAQPYRIQLQVLWRLGCDRSWPPGTFN